MFSGWVSLVAQMVKNLPAMQETQVQEDPLEKEMATHSSILAWRTPWMEEPGGLQCIGLPKVGHNWVTDTSPLSFRGRGYRGKLQGRKTIPSCIVSFIQHLQISLWASCLLNQGGRDTLLQDIIFLKALKHVVLEKSLLTVSGCRSGGGKGWLTVKFLSNMRIRLPG